ncbi:MAG: TetR/AcrR family transcriptional regulator [Frankiaceae bacterium]|nr:TetR/AcrR family transcriptional regulator [Frankiaceae bacterium]
MGGLRTSEAPAAGAAMTVRDELRELTHRRLLSAAQAVFERDGYMRTTIGNITKGANVNRATFYLHFADKADVLRAVLNSNLADTPAYWREVDEALVDGGRGALRAALCRTLDWYQQHGRLLPSVREAVAADPHFAAQLEGTFAGFADEMSGYLARVAPQERSRARLRLQLLIVQLDQVAFGLIVQRTGGIDRELLLDEVTDIWMLVLPPARRPS